VTSATLAAPAEKPRLQRLYTDTAVPALVKKFRYRNAMQVPRLEKAVINIGLGEAIQNGRAIDAASADIKTITGQAPIVIRARKSVAAFKLRAGMPIGIKVTLRDRRMYEIDYDKIDKLRGMEICIVTSAATDDEGHSLLTELGMPFRKPGQQ